MDKRIIISIIAVILVIAVTIGVVALSGGKTKTSEIKQEIELSDAVVNTTFTFKYPDDGKVALQETDIEGMNILTNEEKNYEIQFTVVDELVSTFEENQEADKEEKDYKEVKFNGYKGYTCKTSDTRMEANIILEKVGNVFITLEVEISPVDSYINDDWVDVSKLYNLSEVKAILNSIKYESKTTSIDSETEDEEEFDEENDNVVVMDEENDEEYEEIDE